MNALGSRAPIALEKRVLRRRKQAEEAKHPFPTVLTFFFTAPSIFVSNFPLKGKGRQSFRDLHAESGVARYGSMAKRAPREAKTEVARVWQQRSTRAAILEAARRLAVHEDVSNLSLAKVADEANFSPNTVYAYFVNKSELMVAVVADDLAALAREMRDVFPANEDMEADAPPQTEDDAQGEEQGQSEPVEAAMEDTRDAMDASLPPESVSEITPRETEDLPVVATVGTIDEVSHGPEPQSVSESVEAAPVETFPETAPELAELEPEGVQDPAPSAETVDAQPAPDAPPAPVLNLAEDAHEEPAPREFVDEKSEASAESRMPLVQKKWALHSEADAPEPKASETVAPEVDAPETERDDETASALATLQESVAKLEARPVDAWLERRLRELERMIASLEERQGNSERSAGTAAGVLEENVRGMQARLEAMEKSRQLDFEGNAKAFGERMDASEKRLREMFGELRGLMMMSSSRLDLLESDAQRRAGTNRAEVSPALENLPVVIEAAADKPDTPAENAPASAGEPSYLSQARRSAMAAAAQTVAEPSDPMQRFASTMSSIKSGSTGSRYIIAGGIVLLIVLLGVGLALKRQAADRDSMAPVQMAAASQSGHAKTPPAQQMAPQIRLASLASRGNSDAQLLLGLEYLDGTGPTKNQSEAAQWISRSAAHGNAVAQYWLATLYANGRGVKADPALAMHWYEEAAMQGNRKAMHQLAVSYAEGWGASRNYAEAARWFSRAASLGYVDSAFNLGVLYERGLGMPQSLLDAYKWYSIAAAMGDKGSPPRLAVLKTQMKPEEIADAAQAASSFAPDTLDPSANSAPEIARLPKR
jgi:TPR repeat protein/AcrR family transcriptional regulator